MQLRDLQIRWRYWRNRVAATPEARPAAVRGNLLADRTVIITGGAGRLGTALCEQVAAAGGRVIVHYFRNAVRAEQLAARIEAEGGTARAVAADIRIRSEVDAMVQASEAAFGPIHALVNNAAALPGELPLGSFLNFSWRDYQSYIDTILLGTFNCTQAVLPLMVRQNAGRIVNIGTTAVDERNAALNPYVTAKGGLLGMTRSLAEEFGRYHITVNQVVPGWMWTENREPYSYELRQLRDHSPLPPGVASPVHVAHVVVFLLSDFGAGVTGAYLPVCAGQIKTLRQA